MGAGTDKLIAAPFPFPNLRKQWRHLEYQRLIGISLNKGAGGKTASATGQVREEANR